jgi:hypothetical protein
MLSSDAKGAEGPFAGLARIWSQYIEGAALGTRSKTGGGRQKMQEGRDDFAEKRGTGLRTKAV